MSPASALLEAQRETAPEPEIRDSEGEADPPGGLPFGYTPPSAEQTPVRNVQQWVDLCA
jgi:hypothetical protein